MAEWLFKIQHYRDSLIKIKLLNSSSFKRFRKGENIARLQVSPAATPGRVSKAQDSKPGRGQLSRDRWAGTRKYRTVHTQVLPWSYYIFFASLVMRNADTEIVTLRSQKLTSLKKKKFSYLLALGNQYRPNKRCHAGKLNLSFP